MNGKLRTDTSSLLVQWNAGSITDGDQRDGLKLLESRWWRPSLWGSIPVRGSCECRKSRGWSLLVRAGAHERCVGGIAKGA